MKEKILQEEWEALAEVQRQRSRNWVLARTRYLEVFRSMVVYTEIRGDVPPPEDVRAPARR